MCRYEYREVYLREALLLLTRTIIGIIAASSIHASSSQSDASGTYNEVFMNISMGLLFLCGRCASENDLVPKLARM
jgi:hypothetical protein